MSKFSNGIAFIIMNDSDITTKILNCSTSRSKNSMPSKTSGGVIKRIVETTEPINEVFLDYTLYDTQEITPAWDAIVED